MVIVSYMKCVLFKALTIRVMYDGGGLLHDDGRSILHEVCISRGIE